MAYCSEIINEIDAAILTGSLTDKRFQNRAFAGLCFLTPAKISEGNQPVIIPAKVSTVGECHFIVPDDTFNIITYHRILSNTYSPARIQFGDSNDFQNSITEILLTVIGFTKKLMLTADEIEALFIAGFPNQFTTAFKSSIQMKALSAQVVSSNFDSNSIFNTEYRGEKYFLKPETIMFQIRYRIDSTFQRGCFTICCDESEEEEIPVEGGEMVLAESDFVIPMEFASTTTTDMFFTGSTQRIGKDVGSDDWFDILETGGFKSLYAHGGAFTKEAHVVIDDTDRIGGEGMGWNPGPEWDEDADPAPDCDRFDGELCGEFLLNGENLDFYNSHIDLVDLRNLENIVSANITTGTVEEVYWQIDRTIAVTGQAVIPILFGLESPTSETGQVVAQTTCDFIEHIEAEYPDQEFIFVFDAAELWNPGGAETAYNTALVSNISVDMSKVAIRLYCHGFKLWQNLLNGNPVNDVEVINTVMEETMPAFSQAIVDSAFNSCKVYIAQLSSNYFAGVPYNSPVTKGKQYFTAVYPRMLKHFIEKARDGVVNYFGAAPAGVNQWINAANDINLDFKFFSVMNRLIESNTNALNITYTGDSIDMYGGKRDGKYHLIIQNRGDADYILPEVMTLDGVVTQIEVEYSIGEFCLSITSEDSETYTPVRTQKARSINYLIIKSAT